MRWYRIRKAEIDKDLRDIFEHHGVNSLTPYIKDPDPIFENVKGQKFSGLSARSALLGWLTEQYDRAERKETWSLTMEIAITIFVFSDLAINIYHLFQTKCLCL